MQGGRRENAGRPKGSKEKKTIEKKKAEQMMKQRILKRLNPLLNSQFSLAEGLSFVYKVVETGTGKEKKREHILVDNPTEIKEFLDECEGGDGILNETYYYITTKVPDNKAIDSMLDRVFGKATQKLGGDKENPFVFKPIYGGLSKKNGIQGHNGDKKDIPAEQEN